MKHAYLILAHNEFPVLQLLIQALDDARNDLFIHFDKKVSSIPRLKTKYASLTVLEDRIDVCWGDLSVVEAEYLLFEEAAKQDHYSYYHLLSGVDMPLRSQNEIHQFFKEREGTEFIGFSSGDLEKHIVRKVKRYHLFPKSFRSATLDYRRVLRAGFLRMQEFLGVIRNKHIHFKKGTQWISVTHEFGQYLLSKKLEVLQTYHHTFCSDEIFAQTLCWNSNFRSKVYDLENEANSCVRNIGWKNNKIEVWTLEDYEELMRSSAVFARKFSSSDLEVVEKILDQVKSS